MVEYVQYQLRIRERKQVSYKDIGTVRTYRTADEETVEMCYNAENTIASNIMNTYIL